MPKEKTYPADFADESDYHLYCAVKAWMAQINVFDAEAHQKRLREGNPRYRNVTQDEAVRVVCYSRLKAFLEMNVWDEDNWWGVMS